MKSGWDILIIEDDALLARAYKMVLSNEGYAAQHCPDGESALALLQQQTPDIIFLDMNLPDISGCEVLHVLQADRRFDHTQIILSTGDHRIRPEQYGGTMALFKPVSYDALIGAVQSVTESRLQKC